MKRLALFIIILLTLAVSGCSPAPQKPATLKVAVMTTLDALPVYVADKEGLFARQNLQVEIIPVPSAPERDQLMQSGQIDGMITELVSTMLYNQQEARLAALRFARTATAEYPVFRILAAKDSGIKTVQDLSGVEIAISDGTVIQYTTERILQKAGLSASDIKEISVPKIPERMALLDAGKLKAANLPDPAASLAIKNGAVNVIDDTSYPEISYSVYSFSRKSMKENPAGVRAFMAAVEEAVRQINADKTRWDSLLAELKLIPAPLQGSFKLPDYPTAGVPSQEQFADALAWAKEKGMLKSDLTYESSIDASFLPK